MYICLLVLVAASVAYGNRIFGGTIANIADFPYQISLEINEKHECGGSILTPTKILTAAHCTFNESIGELRVRAGSTFRERGGQVVNVSNKVEHPDFDPNNFNSDVSILILSEPLVLNDNVKTIEIAQIADVPIGTTANVTGWGLTEANELANSLVFVDVPRADDKICEKEFVDVYNTTVQICYGGIVGKDSCSNDSGGPLVIDGELYGVVSFGPFPCATVIPGAYVKLHFFRDFIANTN